LNRANIFEKKSLQTRFFCIFRVLKLFLLVKSRVSILFFDMYEYDILQKKQYFKMRYFTILLVFKHFTEHYTKICLRERARGRCERK